MDSLLNFSGTIIVSIIGLIGIIIQKNHSTKLEDQKTLTKNIQKSIDDLRKESKDDDAKLNKKLDDTRMNSLKRFLVNELSKIKEGNYIPNEEQKRMLKDAKDEYNAAGGDSYVDDMYDDMREKGLI